MAKDLILVGNCGEQFDFFGKERKYLRNCENCGKSEMETSLYTDGDREEMKCKECHKIKEEW